MPLGDLAEKCAVLDALFGAGRAASMASSHDVALYTGNPYAGGVEITGAGYSRVTVANDATWPAADPTTASKSVTVAFPAATGTWDEFTVWVLFNGTAITAWEQLNDPVDVVAGPGPSVQVTVYIPDASNVSI